MAVFSEKNAQMGPLLPAIKMTLAHLNRFRDGARGAARFFPICFANRAPPTCIYIGVSRHLEFHCVEWRSTCSQVLPNLLRKSGPSYLHLMMKQSDSVADHDHVVFVACFDDKVIPD